MKLSEIVTDVALTEMMGSDVDWLQKNLMALERKRRSAVGSDTTRIDALIMKHKKALAVAQQANEGQINELGMDSRGNPTPTLHNYIDATLGKVVKTITGPGFDNIKKAAKLTQNAKRAQEKIKKNQAALAAK